LMRKLLLNLVPGEPLALVKELAYFENSIQLDLLLASVLDLHFLSRPPIMVLTTVLNSCGQKTSDWPLLYKKRPIGRPHIPDSLGGLASFRFAPLGFPAMPPGTPLCSFKRARQDDLGSALQSGRWAFRGRENNGSTVEVFLHIESSTRCREVHQILHCPRHCQTDHLEARSLYSNT